MKKKKGLIQIMGDTIAYLAGKPDKIETSDKLEITQETEREEVEKDEEEK